MTVFLVKVIRNQHRLALVSLSTLNHSLNDLSITKGAFFFFSDVTREGRFTEETFLHIQIICMCIVHTTILI